MKLIKSAEELRKEYEREASDRYRDTYRSTWNAIAVELERTAKSGSTEMEYTTCIPFDCLSEEKSEEIMETIGRQLDKLGYNIILKLEERQIASMIIRW